MPHEAAEVHRLAGQRLRAHGLHYTKGRQQLVELLASIDRPVTMMELMTLEPRLTQSSLYRNLADFETAGVLQKVLGSEDRTRYELAEALIGHHHHTVCSSCGSIADVVLPNAAERALDRSIIDALASSGFRATGHRLDILGICTNCG